MRPSQRVPVMRFFYDYLLREGILDGGPGFQYCRLMARYEKMIVENLRLLRGCVTSGGRERA